MTTLTLVLVYKCRNNHETSLNKWPVLGAWEGFKTLFPMITP